MTTTHALALLLLAACGGAATSTATGPAKPPATAPATAAPEVSLERIERIAQACLADRAGAALDWGTIQFARGAAGWRVRVDEAHQPAAQPSYVDIVVDPAASTCDGRTVASQPEAGDAGFDAVAAIARRCHTGAVEEAKTEVVFHRLATGAIDRGRYEVVFYTPGTAVTFPMPHYLVDAAADTCKKLDDRF